MSNELNQPQETPTLEYRAGVSKAERRARRFRLWMLIAAIFSLSAAIILIMHPVAKMSEVQDYFGGGVIGTPFSPLTLTTPGTDRLVHDEAVLDQYLPRGLFYT